MYKIIYAELLKKFLLKAEVNCISAKRLFLTGVLYLPATVSAAVHVTVNETIVPEHCEVNLSGLDAAESMDWGNLTSESLNKPAAVSEVKIFNLSLTKCGNSYGSTVPTITVSGSAIGTIPASSEYLFRQSSSKAQGVGFIMRFNDTSVTWIGKGNDPNLKNGTIISTSGGDLKLPENWKTGAPIPIAVALSTGDLNRQTAGYVQGSVSFTFEYK
ncbi:hypothetical protein N5863_29030 (plasmid) [Klebsiella pasteurii]|uniref:fimbrial protein n=1 Tax=Klebsiella pasteurii TaxID=2587529 RepID=UPI0025437B6D|nr:fimbrial protein [Klebsiella pasteurii]WII85139.1 hypothetical protein N5863_29030 [Klebsiella pasteurii]